MVLGAGADVIEKGIEGADPAEVDGRNAFSVVGRPERRTVLDAQPCLMGPADLRRGVLTGGLENRTLAKLRK
jgi:hypothetical protein